MKPQKTTLQNRDYTHAMHLAIRIKFDSSEFFRTCPPGLYLLPGAGWCDIRQWLDRSPLEEGEKTGMAIPFNKPRIIGEELQNIAAAVALGQLSGDGAYTKRCSEVMEDLTDSRKVLLTHSCTAALEMSVILADVQPGDEVIMPSFNFVSGANAVALRGGVPVFVDVDPLTLNISPEQVESALTERTRAIIAVHYAGVPAEMDSLGEIARQKNLVLIEDAAQAIGSRYRGKLAGGLGDLATFSFHETKNVISGEGGAICINNPSMVERAEIIREKGTNRSRFLRGQVDKYTWVDIGSSYLPGEIISAFLLPQLLAEREIRTSRLEAVNRYRSAFQELESRQGIGLPHCPEWADSNGHMFYLVMRNQTQRDGFIRYMAQHGINTPFHYVPLHSSPAGKRCSRHVGAMENTNRVSQCLVRLPLYLGIEEEIDQVIDRVHKFFECEASEMAR